MAWLRIESSEEQQRVVNAERDEHPCHHVRRKMLVLWLLHNDVTREKAAAIAGLGRATVQRYVAAFGDGGLDGLRHWGVSGPVSDLAAHAQAIEAEFTREPGALHGRSPRTHRAPDRHPPPAQPRPQVPRRAWG